MSHYFTGLIFALLVLSAHVLADLDKITVTSSTTSRPRRTPKTARTTVSPTTTTTVSSVTSSRTTRSARASSTTTKTTPKPTKSLATHPPWPEEKTTRARATHAPWPSANHHQPSPSEPKKKVATHAPWPSDTYSYGMATHAPYPYGQSYGSMHGQNEHFFPAKSTYAPYVYGSDPDKAKKKNLLPFSVFDREIVNNWAKELITYLAAPLLVPAAITNAFSNIPAGLETETLWGKIARSLKSAFLKRSEERDGGESVQNMDNVLVKMKNRLKSGASFLKKFQSTIVTRGGNSSEKDSSESSKTVEKKVRDVSHLRNRLVDFFRWKRHRQDPSPPSI